MADKKTNREKLNEITASIEQGIKELFQSDKYAQYLRTMSRFHTYSSRNVILIHMQRPNATVVAGFNAWKNKFQRHVKKGERGITILAPTPFKKTVEDKKLDPVTNAPMVDKDGNVIMEEKVIEIPMFRPVKVFDVSQTEGKPLPTLASPLTGDVQNYEIFMEALRRTSPVPITMKPLQDGLDGFFSHEHQAITLREGMSEVQTICAAVHEITHSILHNKEKERLSAAAGTEQAEKVKPKDRNTEEVEAESVSYAVCQYYGIETGENSLGYIATWSKDRSLPELKASLETIGKTANQLITDIDRHFKEICKERGVDLTPPEQAAPEAEAPAEPSLDTQPEQTAPEVEAPAEPPVETQPEQNVLEPSPAAQPEVDTAITEPTVAEEISPAVEPEESAPLEDTALDEYPMPDPSLTVDELEQNYGYTGGDLLPLPKERAEELLERDLTIYAIVDGGEAEMVFDREDLDERPLDMMFAVPKEEWEASQDFREAVADRMNHQEEREQAFLNHSGDCFALYQLRPDDSTRHLRYESLASIKNAGESPQRGNYELAYTGKLAPGGGLNDLNKLWEMFNVEHPADYQRPSMSVSDIVALKQDGVVCCYYADSFGFAAVPDFIKPENYLKAAEMSMEDDYGMLDGIINNGPKEPTVAELEEQARSGQPISLMDLAAAVHREQREKKKSVVEKLKSLPKQEQKKPTDKTRKRSFER